ncbi:hypothetical protein JVT61DRAFT_13711 [Boletus reticuloceps]|uniref:Uncharacterized protein n=1 Tax=Boletus reticuloceps TaxID=495285 RepID=A0A8I2YV97_9AGAM|nr:hypothetical protein JVT61DRAFT_13711 [Boletus reticuloceps]
MKRSVAHHVHCCLMKKKAAEAEAELTPGYVPHQCCWTPCAESEKMWAFQREFMDHMDKHIHNTESCRWIDPENGLCEENSMADWPSHFARGHSVNICKTAAVHYCYVCSIWSQEVVGNGLDWEVHCHEHYDELFAQCSQHSNEQLQIQPVGIQLFPETYQYISYKVETGFRGEFPEYHGHVEGSIVFAPMFCIWCVHDESLSMVERMAQYHDEDIFYGHLATHMDLINNDSLCPSPACGSKPYAKQDLLYHLVTINHLGVCGREKGGSGCRLRLHKIPTCPAPSTPAHSAQKHPLSESTEDLPRSILGRKQSQKHNDRASFLFRGRPD